MDNKSNVGENTDLALTGLSNLGKFIGIALPLPPVNAITFIIDNIQQRRNKKHLDRLEKLVQSLDRRLTRLEGNVPETPDIDLFDEIVAKAVSDEDEDKTELYAALVQYWMEHKPVPYEVRLLGNAIRELTIYEIKTFNDCVVSQNPEHTQKMPEQLEEIFWDRITYLGLYVGGAGHHYYDKVTQIGKKLVEIYQLSIAAK